MKKKPRVLHERDTFIMDHILQLNMSQKEVNMVNKVRLHLPVETLTEIATRREPRLTMYG